jgi:hypothetical protein
MLLLWWCPFKIQKANWAGLQFTRTDFLSLVLTPLRIRWTIPLSCWEWFYAPIVMVSLKLSIYKKLSGLKFSSTDRLSLLSTTQRIAGKNLQGVISHCFCTFFEIFKYILQPSKRKRDQYSFFLNGNIELQVFTVERRSISLPNKVDS